MKLNFIFEALLILFTGFVLLRIAGKKTVLEMTGLEIITLLAMASMIGHAVAGNGLLKTMITLCIFVTLLITIQFLAIKFNFVERLFMGKAAIVVENGQIVPHRLKKLRMSVDQLEAKLRGKGIEALSDVKTVTIEVDGNLGFEWQRHAKPVTIGDLEKMIPQLIRQTQDSQKNEKNVNLFEEVIQNEHQEPHSKQLN